MTSLLGPSWLEAGDEVMRGTVRSARLVFSSYAASIFLHLPEEGVLSLRATSETDADHLLDLRIPADSGVAGFVFQTGQPQIVSNVADSAQFNAEAAESTGYVPTTIVAAPLTFRGVTRGVLEVLDPGTVIDEIDQLRIAEELALQCAAALSAVESSAVGGSPSDDELVLSNVLEGVHRLGLSERTEDRAVLAAIDTLLRATS